MTNPLSSSPRHHASQTATKAWKAPAMQVARAADAQVGLASGTVDGSIVVGVVTVNTYSS